MVAGTLENGIGRGEYVTMGRFVGHLTPACIAAAVEVMDDRSLLRVAFVLESKESLKDLIGVLPADRLDGIIGAAAEENLWPEVLDLLTHLTLEQRQALVERAAARDDGSTLAALLAAAQQEDMWAELLPLIPLLPEKGRERVAAIVAAMDPGQREEISQRLRAAGLMDRLGPLGEALLDGRPS